MILLSHFLILRSPRHLFICGPAVQSAVPGAGKIRRASTTLADQYQELVNEIEMICKSKLDVELKPRAILEFIQHRRELLADRNKKECNT